MNFNFELILFYAVLTSGVLLLIDKFLFSRKRKLQSKKLPLIIEYAKSFFPILLLVFSARSFGYEAFRIPSGSLKPTILIGDLILVNKFDYGIRLPIIRKKIISIGEPKRGDIVVFHGPPTEPPYLIKRVIGLPGDHLIYKDKILYINGKKADQTFDKFSFDDENDSGPWQVVEKNENLLGVTHKIFQIPDKEEDNFDVIVPAGHYFMMGDNRDNSLDSRAWGFLDEKNIIGKATRVLVSYDKISHPLRWKRTGETII